MGSKILNHCISSLYQKDCVNHGGDCLSCPHSLASHFQDILDEMIQKKNALGFIADHLEDPQAGAAVHLVEQDLENMIENSWKILHP